METEEETFGSVEKHAITEDDGERITPEKKGGGEDSRKAGKQPVSRIPTFQSSMARKRPTSHSAEPSPSSAKMETSVPQSQSKEKGSTSGETKLPLYGARDTALPIPFVRLTPISTDALSRHDLSDHIASPSEVTSSAQQGDHSPDANFGTASDTEELQTPLGRPAIRAESRSHVTDGSFDSDQDYSSGSESVGKGLFSEDVEREPHDDKQVKTNLISISSASDDAMKMGFEYSETIEHCDETDDEQTEKEAFCLPDEIKHEHDEDEKLCLSEGKITEENSAEVCSEAPTLPSSGSHLGKFNKASVSEEHLLKHPKTVQKTKEKEKFSSQSGQEKKTTHSPSSKRKGKGFAVFCLFPTILLLLVGFGQHIWLYGIPKSVSHLMIQLELHWLEGFWMPQESCSSDCRLTLVESIPEGLVYTQDPPHLLSIAHGWRNLLYRANSSVDIAAFYFTLRDSDLALSLQGEDVFRQLMHLESTGVNLKVAVNDPQTSSADTDDLAATGAEVRAVDLRSITGGIIHTKLWVVDKKHMYMGSANMDWRSLTQVKELGVSVEDCSCLAQDASRIFGIYWDIGAQKNGSLPPYWPGRFSALSSSKYPLVVKFNGVPARVYLSSAPPALSAYGRTDDLSAILTVIADAKQFISISVMDYLPFSQFIQPPRFWPAIDSALREAACARDVEVNLLVSCWPHSPSSMFVFLQSLMVLSRPPLECKINVKIFRVPSTQEQSEIPFARVNHAKYMVTDRVAYIGTSNWSENYFTQTAGVGLVINQTDSVVNEGQETVQSQLHSIFQRDWTSDFAETLSDSVAEHCSKRRQP